MNDRFEKAKEPLVLLGLAAYLLLAEGLDEVIKCDVAEWQTDEKGNPKFTFKAWPEK